MERHLLISAVFTCAAAFLTACSGGEASVSSGANNAPTPTNAKSSIAHAPSNTTAAPTTPAEAPGVTSSHGGGGAVASPPSSAGQNRPRAETAPIDAKIQKAVAKAKSAKASEADKRAAADAYFERAEFYWGAGDPSLYKYALADYKSVLHYQPENSAARERLDTLISIYKTMKRPVPDLSNEQ